MQSLQRRNAESSPPSRWIRVDFLFLLEKQHCYGSITELIQRGDSRLNRIVVIDDEEIVCSSIKKLLESLKKYEVKYATSGQEGLKLVSQYQPNLIILDVMMPDMSGLEILNQLKKRTATSQIPVVMLTGYDDEVSMHEAMDSYAEEYILKPATREELEQKISYILSKRGNI